MIKNSLAAISLINKETKGNPANRHNWTIYEADCLLWKYFVRMSGPLEKLTILRVIQGDTVLGNEEQTYLQAISGLYHLLLNNTLPNMKG